MKTPGRWALASCIAAVSIAQSLAKGPAPAITKPLPSVQFKPDDDVKCLSSALEAGDAKTGPSTWVLRAPNGCVVPWHTHTAEEQLIIVSGSIVAEMLDHAPTQLGPGGFAMMGSHMPHQFTCRSKSGCLMFITFDGAYDIKWGKGG
jgi:mannose-6-phosphate isomerase-like protein (cupin superfamily)